MKAKYFGSFSLPVRGRRRPKQRRYSDVLVTRYDILGNTVHVGTVAAERPKGNPMRWEPELAPKKKQ